ncbi:hypothetical protein L1987_52353 [Smallanthus sonchifolius]|uniref:Uncharacterized protein n=1 Tax=Smallanthus sonchifolius TaxID=185202 RepID=A0ACB9ETG6_9ASTR|nr:hypothetical protein L1987_52353 [Smallanthus sonchifolius]
MGLFPLQESYTLGLAITLVLFCLLFIYKATKKTNTAPEASGGWPILGHLNLLNGSSELPHLALASMADQYGPIFTIRLGVRRVLVVSNWEIAKEIFTTHDLIVSNRPKYIAAKILGYNYASVSFAPYGPYWLGIRKIISTELVSGNRVEKLKFVRVFELETPSKTYSSFGRRRGMGKGKCWWR